MKKLGFALVVTMLISGCSMTTQLANGKGNFATCQSTGVGLLSAPIASVKHSNCVSKYKGEGFFEVVSDN